MKLRGIAAIAAAGVIALAACQPAAKNTAADEDAVGNASEGWVAMYTAGDADGIAAMYTDDAILMPPGAPSVTGRAAIAEFIAGDISNTKAASMTLKIDASTGHGVSGDFGWKSGNFSVSDAAGATVDTGKFLEVWRRGADGKWLMIRDTWNSDNAPAAPPAPTT